MIIKSMEYSDLFYKLQERLKFDNDEKCFILDIRENEYKELKEYFKFNSIPEANLTLKVWVSELQNKNMDKIDEDSVLEFLKIKYFMTLKDRLIKEGRIIEGIGNNS